MIKVGPVILVEGKYDKIKLSQIFDATILTTDGFGIFKQKDKLALLRRLAETRGLLIFTDPDGAGFVIRNRIKSCISPQHLKHAYIPDVPGKERRKTAPGREGKLGVEGMTREVIYDALRRCGATIEGENITPVAAITKQDMMELGLSGGTDSSAKRLALMKQLDLPQHMSANALLQALNLLCTLDELKDLVHKLENNHG